MEKGAKPQTPPENLAELRGLAGEHSRGTAYWSFYNYVLMVTGYITKDVEAALAAHDEIRRENLWPVFNLRFNRIARISRSIYLSATGDFAAARREFADLQRPSQVLIEGAEGLMLGLFIARLDFAAGAYEKVPAQTLPDGPFGEQSMEGAHRRRYAPISLVLRGSVYMIEGNEDQAIDCFLRATQQSVMNDEWLSLLCGETHEYRAWLESLDRDDLPAGLTPRGL